MYGNYLDDAAKIVAEKRAENLKFEHARLTADEKDELLKKFHPDRIAAQFTELKIGPNKGQKAPLELAEMLEAKPRIEPEHIDLSHIDYESDVLVIGRRRARTRSSRQRCTMSVLRGSSATLTASTTGAASSRSASSSASRLRVCCS